MISIMYIIILIFTVVLLLIIIFFFFKQKTAYEMRISDWSSDVCSSDLSARQQPLEPAFRCHCQLPSPAQHIGEGRQQHDPTGQAPFLGHGRKGEVGVHFRQIFQRSEEHTSELQSLMRISYAVFCLKKKI